MLERIVCLFVGYLFGTLLTAEAVANALEGTSIFELGDGNPGMANVGQTLGKSAAAACLAGDILKTLAAMTLSHALFPSLGAATIAWAGLGATLGHVFPFWHEFKGGKGVVTIIVTFILLNPIWGVISAVLGLLSIFATGYLSIAAVIIVACYLVAMLLQGSFELALLSLFFLGITLYCHGSKLRGISDGTTKKVKLFK